MTLFDFLSIGVSLVLGLGVTLLLTSLLAAFRARRRVRMDWIPFAWAGYILVIQAQYYWVTWGLHEREEWTVVSFGIPLLLAGVIFVAAGLVLPSGHGEYPADLGTYFEQDGKWAVAALVVRGAVAFGANVLVMGGPALSIVHGLVLSQVATALMFLLAKTRGLRVLATLLYGLMLSVTLVLATPFSH